MPLLLGAVTDGRFFSRLGIQTYGYHADVACLQGWSFIDSIHAADDAYPVEAMTFGSAMRSTALSGSLCEARRSSEATSVLGICLEDIDRTGNQQHDDQHRENGLSHCHQLGALESEASYRPG